MWILIKQKYLLSISFLLKSAACKSNEDEERELEIASENTRIIVGMMIMSIKPPTRRTDSADYSIEDSMWKTTVAHSDATQPEIFTHFGFSYDLQTERKSRERKSQERMKQNEMRNVCRCFWCYTATGLFLDWNFQFVDFPSHSFVR